MLDSTDNLPVFPLDTVLVPRMVIPLRIFEDRYKLMLEHCRRDQVGFGVALLRSGQETGAGQPHDVGTIAKIRDERALPNDEALVIGIGTSRFRILRFTQEKPYLRATVAPVEDDSALVPEDDADQQSLTSSAQEFFGLLSDAKEEISLPDDPESLGWVLTARLPMQNAERQRLLEMTSLPTRLRTLVLVLEKLLPEARKQSAARAKVKELIQTNGKLSSQKPWT